MKDTLNPGDSIARISGDEFAVLMIDIDKESTIADSKSRKICEKIRQKIAEPYWLGDTECNLTASIGITLLGIEQDDATHA